MGSSSDPAYPDSNFKQPRVIARALKAREAFLAVSSLFQMREAERREAFR
jgi:hypothetical protein